MAGHERQRAYLQQYEQQQQRRRMQSEGMEDLNSACNDRCTRNSDYNDYYPYHRSSGPSQSYHQREFSPNGSPSYSGGAPQTQIPYLPVTESQSYYEPSYSRRDASRRDPYEYVPRVSPYEEERPRVSLRQDRDSIDPPPFVDDVGDLSDDWLNEDYEERRSVRARLRHPRSAPRHHHQQQSFPPPDRIEFTPYREPPMDNQYNNNNSSSQIASPKMVEISPGTFRKLRGAQETNVAIQNDFFVPCQCIICENETIFCIKDAEFVICPLCRTVSPVEDGGGDGVGLGFTLQTLSEVQAEVAQRMMGRPS